MQDTNLRRALAYRRFMGTPRLLFLHSNYLVIDDAIAAAQQLQWHVEILPSAMGREAKTFIAELLTKLVQFRPDYLVTINHLGFDQNGTLAQLLANFEIPVASWFVDHPVLVLGGVEGDATRWTQVFCFERQALAWLSKRGYLDPRYLPTAAQQAMFRQPDAANATTTDAPATISFVGNSWWSKARIEPPSWARKHARLLLKQQHAVPQLLADAPQVWSLALKTLNQQQRATTAKTALAEASLRKRQRFVQDIAPLGIHVYGDPHWQHLAPRACVFPPIIDRERLAQQFAQAAINLNITAEQMPTAVNQRVWDVPAAHGFLLTDAQDDALLHFNEGQELVVYRSYEEAADKIRYYQAHPAERQAISQRAHARVAAEHCYSHRLQTLHRHMQQRFSG